MKAIAIVSGRPETAGLIELPEPPCAGTGRSWLARATHYAPCDTGGVAADTQEGPEEIKIVIDMAGTV
jgi:hypothetical protein